MCYELKNQDFAFKIPTGYERIPILVKVRLEEKPTQTQPKSHYDSYEGWKTVAAVGTAIAIGTMLTRPPASSVTVVVGTRYQVVVVHNNERRHPAGIDVRRLLAGIYRAIKCSIQLESRPLQDLGGCCS